MERDVTAETEPRLPAPTPEAEAATPSTAPDAEARPTFIITFRSWLHDYFLGDKPTFALAVVPFAFLSMLLFTRHPRTNFIFDEQEALLANPYVRSVADPQPKFLWRDAFYRDFWGLGPERSIGSYRPIPNIVWRALWAIGAREQTPFLHHWVNVLLHGVNGALVCLLTFHLTKRKSTAWLAGAAFTASAVLTEAVSGVVGIADVLGATGALLALLALTRKNLALFALGIFFGTLFGLYSKESALCCVPLLPIFALLVSPILHPEKPQRWTRAIIAAVCAAAAFVLYVEARRRMFPAALPAELSVEANAEKGFAGRTFAALLRWYAQPTLPRDPLNNPLVRADGVHRVAGALRVWMRGLAQVVSPAILSGDYSAPQEPIPPKLVSFEIVFGVVCMIVPFVLGTYYAIRGSRRSQSLGPVIAASLLWVVFSYFPVSNIPVLLPTVRAERFWYFPVIGTSIVLGIAFTALLDRFPRLTEPATWQRNATIGAIVLFFGYQAIAARRHANDYTDDLAFWDATRQSVPRSAKAHLNYSVMKGARGDLKAREDANRTALELAPEWPMASVYLGDTICRQHRAPEAWPHYVRGFELAPNDVNLIALGAQCLWDEKALDEKSNIRAELDALKEKPEHNGSWLQYIARDILEHGEEHNGVDPKYRPRGYNEGPKD